MRLGDIGLLPLTAFVIVDKLACIFADGFVAPVNKTVHVVAAFNVSADACKFITASVEFTEEVAVHCVVPLPSVQVEVVV